MIVQEIKDGIKAFEANRPIWLTMDYSKNSIGFFLFQKHGKCAWETIATKTTGNLYWLDPTSSLTHVTVKGGSGSGIWIGVLLNVYARMSRIICNCGSQTTDKNFFEQDSREY